MKNSISQGALAVMNGNKLENAIASILSYCNYTYVRAETLAGLLGRRGTLFPDAGVYARQVKVPLRSSYHHTHGTATVDFVVLPSSGEVVLISVKSQTSDGSADQKVEFEYQQLVATEWPSALLIDGPLKGTDADHGWSPAVLLPTWERMLHFGEKRLYPFRNLDKLSSWIRAGLPVAGRGRTWSSIFGEYCCRTP